MLFVDAVFLVFIGVFDVTNYIQGGRTQFSRALLMMQYLARAQGFQRTNRPSVERSFYLLNTRTICPISLYN